MYGIPPGTDLSFLIGLELENVSIGHHSVVLNLHPDTSVMIATDVRLFSDGPATLEDAKSIGVSLLPFLGRSIVEAEGSPDGTLKLTWSDGHVFEILDSAAEYESYTIRHGNQTLVV